MQVCIDDREHQDRIKRAVEYFKQQKTDEDGEYQVFVEEMRYGDYLFHDTWTNIDVVFEYKTIDDFISSINDHRVFNQALNQSNYFEYHFVIVVGTDKEKSEVISEKQRYTGRYITNEQFYGAYASLVNVTSLIQVPTEKIAFMVMNKVALKCCSDKPVVKRFSKSRGTPAFRLLNNNVERIGYIKAENICKELDLVTIDDVLGSDNQKGISYQDLISVDGIGKVTAKSVLEQLKREFDLE